VSSTFLGLSSRPYLLASAVCHCLSSRRLHNNYTRKPRAPPKSRATCLYPRAACLPSLLVSPTPPSTICVSTTRSCRLPFLSSTTPYINILRKYSALFKISSMSGLWTADTWAMSADAQLCDSGQWTPRDRRWQFWPCIPEVWTPHGEE
jgi:hypothetical protein